MKIKLLFIAFCLFCSSVFAEQRILVLKIEQGKFDASELKSLLLSGWKVITATPILVSTSNSNRQASNIYTEEIIYILEKNSVKDINNIEKSN